MNWRATIERHPGRIALLLILIASLRVVATYRPLSHTTDEPAHLAAGIEWIENGTYTYEDQHPPLARVAGALGLHLTGSRWTHDPDMYQEGYKLLGQHDRYGRALFYSRLFMLPFFWVGAAGVYLWGMRTSPFTAVFSTLIFTTTPPILAHAGLATTDMAVTAFVTATLTASLWWADKSTVLRSVTMGTFLGLALLSKFSALAFLPTAWLLMYVAHLATRRPGLLTAGKRAAALIPGALTAALTAALLIWAGYRFTIGHVDFLNASLPAPAFFTGIHYVMAHNREGHLAYLLGQRSQLGFWYYYPVVLAVKTPLATLLLMIAALWLAVRRAPEEIAMPLSLTAAALGIGLFSHINIGVRHILPIYASLALCAGMALERLLTPDRGRTLWLGAALIAWQCVTGLVIHPDYLSYTNELTGPRPERILADSDLDWGQGMRGLALRLEQRHVEKLTFRIDSSAYMIASGHRFPHYVLMPDGDTPAPGWNAVSTTAWALSGQPTWMERVEPLEKIHHSIYLFYFPPGP